MIPLAIVAASLACGIAAWILLSSIVIVRKKRKNETLIDGLPVVPNSHWLFGHFAIFRKMLNSADFEEAQRILCYDHANSDGLSTFSFISGGPWMSVTRPEDVRKVLTAAHNRRPTAIQQRHSGKFLGRRSLLSLRGREWRYWRSVVHRSFTPAALEGLRRPMVDAASNLVKSLGRRIDNAGEGSITVDVEPLMKMVTMDVFGSTALGIDFECCSKLTPSPVAAAFDFLSDQLIWRFRTFYRPTSHFYGLPTQTNRRHKRESAKIRGVLAEAIRSRRNGSVGAKGSTGSCDGDDLLSHLIQAVEDSAHKDGNEKAVGLSSETFSDILLTLLFAGYETTAITLTYALYCLAKHPGVEERLIEEINTVLGASPSFADFSKSTDMDPDQLPYCRAIIMETLRLYPPGIQTLRTLEHELVIGGCTVPVGTQVLIPIWSIQRDERYFPRPSDFVPERWVRRDGDTSNGSSAWRDRLQDDGCSGGESDIAAASRDAFFAFSGGARSCVGRKFAMQEAITVLAVLMRDLKFSAADEHYKLEPFRSGIVQQPRGGIPMKVAKRC